MRRAADAAGGAARAGSFAETTDEQWSSLLRDHLFTAANAARAAAPA